MSRSVGFSYTVDRDTLPSGYSSKGSDVTINPSELSSEFCAMFDTTTGATGNIIFNDTIKSHWFPNSTAHPTSLSWTSKHRRTGVIAGKAYIGIGFGDTGIWTSAANTSRSSDTESSSSSSVSTVTSATKSSVFGIAGYATQYKCLLRWITFTFYFTQYDFTATAGSNIATASVSSSTGYDGDTITYSCVLADGSNFDGWYNGSTKVSSSQTYTHTVNGADVSLTAVGTAPTTKTMSATYNGTQLSGFPINVSGNTDIAYNGTTIATVPFSGGTKTLNCSGKLMSGNVTAGGKTLNCSGKVMSGDVVFTIS